MRVTAIHGVLGAKLLFEPACPSLTQSLTRPLSHECNRFSIVLLIFQFLIRFKFLLSQMHSNIKYVCVTLT